MEVAFSWMKQWFKPHRIASALPTAILRSFLKKVLLLVIFQQISWKVILISLINLVETNKTDFSIVAPKDQNEFYYSQSEFDILGPMRDKDFKGPG